jgi:toxin ParE1/3/4
VKVVWTVSAIEQLAGIHEFIAQGSAEYARRVVDRLTRRAEQIAVFPFSGRIVPEADLPQLREIIEGPYRIIYHIKSDQIDIVTILHGARQTPWSSQN